MGTVATKVAPATLAATTFDISNLEIHKVITHRVFSRGGDKTIPPPKLSKKLLKLEAEGRDAIQKRITAAVGNRTHGVEMSIERTDVDSFFQVAADLIHAPDDELITGSQEFAKQLTAAQGTTNAPPGMLAVIRGRVGADPKRYIAVIKADVHDGFGAVGSDEVDIQYLTSLLLTESQKLYKVGFLLEEESEPRKGIGGYDAAGYRIFLFDHLITGTETRTAAAYFYDAFLGMGIQKSSKKLTRDFFEFTNDFIKLSAVDEEQRRELKEALRVELRSSSGTINPAEFAKAHLPKELRVPYREFLAEKNFPKSAVIKDIEYVKSRLRKPRKMVFSTGVQISLPSDLKAGVVEVIEKSPDHAMLRILGSYKEVE